jgi:CubicO group peptidase (beta-lactamase class C family)
MRKFFLFSLFCCFAFLNSHAQKKNAAAFKQLDALIYDQIQKNYINGAVVLILHNNQPLYKKAYGYRNSEHDSLKTDDIFRMASQTKAITTTAVLQLIEEKKIQLHDPVEKYIPEFANPKVIATFNAADTSFTTVPAKRSITIFDLLTHTSGIDYPFIGSEQAKAIYEKYQIPTGIATNKDTLAVAIKKLAALPLLHQPGEKWTYGINLEILGYIIEKISGANLETVFRKKIFEPLGMNSTFISLPTPLQPRLVTLFSKLQGQPLVPAGEAMPDIGPLIEDYPNHPSTFHAGGAGLSGPIEDYGKFLSMLLNNGIWNNKRVLSEESVKEMTRHQIGNIPFSDEFGLGFQINGATKKTSPYMNEGAYLWGGMFGTAYWVDPKEKLVVLLYTNVWPTAHPNFSQEFQKLVYEGVRQSVGNVKKN